MYSPFDLTGFSLIDKIISPGITPDLSEGLPDSTSKTTIPFKFSSSSQTLYPY